MGMKIKVGSVVRDFALHSNWVVASDVPTNAWMSVEVGAKAAVVGKVQLTLSASPFFQMALANKRNATAGQIQLDGQYLPQWPRRYLLDCHQVEVKAGLGVGLSLEPGISVNVDHALGEETQFSPIYRLLGAPVAQDEKHNYVAGDPTGFLGLALTASLGAGAQLGPASGNVSTRITLMNSNYQRALQEASTGKYLESGARLLSTLLLGNHLQFAYSGFSFTRNTKLEIGTSLATLGAASGKVSFGWTFIRAMHLLVKNPKTRKWQYVYTRHIQPNATVSAPHRPAKAGPWKQPKGSP
ncbi:MAG: hypothetical protein FJ096_03815 [Deltaproteobacteria bacterium]|nr:hypothetical protein [Deltaproteobacteria bacterium]